MKTNSGRLTTLIMLICAFVGMAPLASAQKNQQKNHAEKSKEVIPAKFDAIALTKENYAAQVNKCIPTISVDASYLKDSIKNFPSNGITTYQNPKVPSLFVVHQKTAVCMKLSANKYPIFATEAFIDTVNPNGVSQKVMDKWYRQIAILIAQKGSAKIAYVVNNGNAFIVNYSVKSDFAQQLNYSMQFKKAGTWESEKLDSKFTHASLSGVEETKRGGQGAKPFPLSHRNQ